MHAQCPFHDLACLGSQMDAAVIGCIENIFFLVQRCDSVCGPDLWPSVCLDNPSGKESQWERQGYCASLQNDRCDFVGSSCAVFTQALKHSQNVSSADAQEDINKVRRVYVRNLIHFGLGQHTF